MKSVAKQDAEGWGSKIVERMSVDLKAAFHDMKGWSRSNLKYMRQFAEAWRRDEIVQAPLGQLQWYHLKKHIGVSTYQLGLPPPDQLQAKLQKVLIAPRKAKKNGL